MEYKSKTVLVVYQEREGLRDIVEATLGLKGSNIYNIKFKDYLTRKPQGPFIESYEERYPDTTYQVRVVYCRAFELLDVWDLSGKHFQHIAYVNGTYDAKVLRYIESRRRGN